MPYEHLIQVDRDDGRFTWGSLAPAPMEGSHPRNYPTRHIGPSDVKNIKAAAKPLGLFLSGDVGSDYRHWLSYSAKQPGRSLA